MVAGAELHVLALRLGPLALVQPIGVTGLHFALPLSAALQRRPVATGQARSTAAVAVGLIALLASLHVQSPTASRLSSTLNTPAGARRRS